MSARQSGSACRSSIRSSSSGRGWRRRGAVRVLQRRTVCSRTASPSSGVRHASEQVVPAQSGNEEQTKIHRSRAWVCRPPWGWPAFWLTSSSRCRMRSHLRHHLSCAFTAQQFPLMHIEATERSDMHLHDVVVGLVGLAHTFSKLCVGLVSPFEGRQHQSTTCRAGWCPCGANPC